MEVKALVVFQCVALENSISTASNHSLGSSLLADKDGFVCTVEPGHAATTATHDHHHHWLSHISVVLIQLRRDDEFWQQSDPIFEHLPACTRCPLHHNLPFFFNQVTNLSFTCAPHFMKPTTWRWVMMMNPRSPEPLPLLPPHILISQITSHDENSYKYDAGTRHFVN